MPGLSAPDIDLPLEKPEIEEASPTATTHRAEITAAVDLKPGTYKLTARVTSNHPRPLNSFWMTGQRPIEVTVSSWLPPPTIAARGDYLAESAERISVRRTRSHRAGITRGEFDGDVAISFDPLPAGVTVPDIVIPAGQTQAMAELIAEGSTKTGLHKFTATARPVHPGAAPVATEAQLEVLGSPEVAGGCRVRARLHREHEEGGCGDRREPCEVPQQANW